MVVNAGAMNSIIDDQSKNSHQLVDDPEDQSVNRKRSSKKQGRKSL